jgi:hypothetical protein
MQPQTPVVVAAAEPHVLMETRQTVVMVRMELFTRDLL